MNVAYFLGKKICQFVQLNCLTIEVLHPERTEGLDGYVLACSHLSHLEPCIVGMMMKRQIDWMSRIEFYRYHLVASLLDALDAFPVNRQGTALTPIRTAIRRVRAGRIVGIFPEGGVVRGRDSALLGGPIKKGACVIAQWSAAPILPVVVVGTEKLNTVGPWLPFKRARVWMIFGRPIQPRLNEPRRRVAREWLASRLEAEFQSLYREVCATSGVEPFTAGES